MLCYTLDNDISNPHLTTIIGYGNLVHMEANHRRIFLSQRAYKRLCTLTIGYQYSTTKDIDKVFRMRGLHLLIAHTFRHNPPEWWEDTRDSFLRSYDHPHPFDPTITVKMWHALEEYQRFVRSIKITDSTWRRILDVASFHTMEPPRPNKHITLTATSRVGIVLEAWGLGNLTPKEVPINPDTLAHYSTDFGKLTEPTVYF